MPSLSQRPDKTFLIEAGEQYLRVDLRHEAEGFAVYKVLRRGPVATGAEKIGVDRSGNDPFFSPGGREPVDADSLASLLSQRPRPAREITVLSDRLTAVVTDLPAMGGEDWQSGAEMEAQTVSGLATSESVSAATRLPADVGVMRAWVVQAAMRDLAALRSALGSAARRSRLVAVGHPAGIRLESPAAQLENWPEFALFHAPGGERIDLRGWNGPEALADALGDAEVASAFVSSDPPTCLLFGSPGELAIEEEAARLNLTEEKGTAMWANGLARACDPLSGTLLGMPLIKVPKPPPSSAALIFSAAGCAVVVFLILGAHYLLNEMSRIDLESDLARFKIPAEKLAADSKRITELRGELKKIATDAGSGKITSEVDVFAHRKRIGALLDGVAAGAAVKDAVVLEIVPRGLETILTGVATTFNAPQELAGRIDSTLAERGWRAALVRRTAKLLRSDSGPWTYEIRLTPGRPVLESSEDTEVTVEKTTAKTEQANKDDYSITF